MRSTMPRFALAALVACSLCASVLEADNPAADSSPAVGKDAAVAKHVEDFSLRDFHGNVRTLAQYADKKVVVLVYLGTECPLAKLYAPRLGEMARELADKSVQFIGLDANALDTPTKLAAFAEKHRIEFPLLKDTLNAVADRLGATRTPEAFLLDADRLVRYHGRIDDQYLVGAQCSKASRRDLAVAVEELLAGKEVSQSTTPFTGCVIARARKTEPRGDITYSGQVAAIVNRHCVECHREGELAPFPLASYESVVGWAETIREVVTANRMPPWFADPAVGKFSNDCSLNDSDKRSLLAWIDNGCPQGNPSETPAPPAFVSGWRIGQPDITYRMAEPYRVPAEGTVDYQYFIVEPELKNDLWIAAAEARPGNQAVVHHVVLYALGPGMKLANLAEVQAVGKMVTLYAPGMNPWQYPPGTAMKIEKGSTLIIQTHYTPNGTAQDDRSYVGLKLADMKTVKRQVRYGMSVNINIQIPPGAEDYVLVSRKPFLRDALLLNLFPHMHYRGKSFRFEAEYPDGRRELLLDVPHYDFNWQLRYDLAEPKFMPKGSKLVCTAHYDNSDANPLNPDPTKTVRFGLQTWEEMMVGYYSTISAVDEDLTRSKSGGERSSACRRLVCEFGSRVRDDCRHL